MTMVGKKKTMMNKFEKFKSMDIDELIDWLDKNGAFDDSPWIRWWDMTYCKGCEPEVVSKEGTDYYHNMECGWCELHGKCRYFQELDNMPDNKQIIKMWLELECD